MAVHELYRPGRKISPVKRGLYAVGFAVLSFIVIRLFFFESHTVTGTEMLPGAARGDCVLSNRFWNGLRLPFFNNTKILSFIKHDRGDLVFIKHPWLSQSGAREFFDFITLSLFGIADDIEIRLARVLARERESVRVAADGAVYVSGERMERKKVGVLELETSGTGGVLTRKAKYAGAVLYEEKLSQAAASPIKNQYDVYTEGGGWRIAQAETDPGFAEKNVFPRAVTGRAAALTIAENWLLRTALRAGGKEYTCHVIKEGESAHPSEGTLLVRYDAEGNLSYQIGTREWKTLIRVENDVAWLIVPEDMLFVLNDFREAREDSRTWGPIYANTVTGIPFLRIRPLSRFGALAR